MRKATSRCGIAFTARWANENLPTHWRTPAIATAVVLLIVAMPFWYTQLLPRSYIGVLTSETVELQLAHDAYVNLRSFPGHVETADNLFRSFLISRAGSAGSDEEILAVSGLARVLPDPGPLAEKLLADYWDARMRAARRDERRDDALLASLQALVLSTPQRRNRAAMLVADDYPLLLASLADEGRGDVVFDPDNLVLTEIRAAEVTQWSLEPQGLQQRESWSITALEVAPLVRRVFVDREGAVSRIGLTINISHARATDLRIKVIAPSGRAVEVDPNVDRASANQNLRIPASQLSELIGEPISGTWSLSVRDEELGVAGRLVGWNLNLNSQGLIEDFQRGLNIAEPVERETDNIWLSADGRFAVARATQSDSARVWDLAFAKPVRAVAVNELEQLIGLSSGARMLVTATQDTVNLWNTTTGRRSATLPVGAASATSMLTADGAHLFVQKRSDSDTTFELWSLETASLVAQLDVAGSPALVSLDSSGQRIAIADYDRAVRVWDFRSGSLIVQIDLTAQPSDVNLAAGGEVLGVVFGIDGISVWRIDSPAKPLLEEFASGRWQLAFSPSGTRVLAGGPARGFRVYDTSQGRVLGPPLGSGADQERNSLLTFSADEQIVVTSGHIEHLASLFVKTWQRPPTDTELRGLIDSFILEEVLYREARAIGLDQDDTIIRRRLKQKMEFLVDDFSAADPSDVDLQQFMDDDPERFRTDARISFEHVYLVDPAPGAVSATLATLQSNESLEAELPGLAGLLPRRFANASETTVAGQFGAAFKNVLFALDVDRWTGPVESPFGVHLIRIGEIEEGRVPPLPEIRDIVQRDWLSARRRSAQAAFFEQLRLKYAITIEGYGPPDL